jgi:hypothetical protein
LSPRNKLPPRAAKWFLTPLLNLQALSKVACPLRKDSRTLFWFPIARSWAISVWTQI